MNFSFFYETFRLALVNLFLHKLRSFLTALGIVFGVLAVIAMMAIGEGGKRETLKEVELLGASNIIVKSVPPTETRGNTRRDSTLYYGLKRADFDAILAEMNGGMFAGVNLAVPLRESGLDIVRNNKRADAKCAAVATTPDFITVANLALSHGRFLAPGDMVVDNNTPVCVLGAGIAEQLFEKEDPVDLEEPKYVQLQTPNGSRPFAVVGVLKPVGLGGGKGSAMIGRDLNYDLYFPLALDKEGAVIGDGAFGDTIVKRSQGSRESRRVELSQVYLRVADMNNIRPIAAALDRMLKTRHADQNDVALAIPIELIRQSEETQRVWDIVLFFIACLALLVGGIGIMNITLATVTERTREIGIRRALGGKKSHIITQFLIETTTLSTIGGLLGVVLGLKAPAGISWMVSLFSEKPMPTHVTYSSAIVSFTISATVGIVAGLYPAFVAANKDPIEALRHD